MTNISNYLTEYQELNVVVLIFYETCFSPLPEVVGSQ